MSDKPLITVKPCPFCGGIGSTLIHDHLPIEDQPMDEVMVYCRSCMAKQSDIDHKGADHYDRARDVLKRWNRRVVPNGFKR